MCLLKLIDLKSTNKIKQMITVYSVAEVNNNLLCFNTHESSIISILDNASPNTTLIIGRKTWFSLEHNIRKSITNDVIVFTRDKSIKNDDTSCKNVKYMDSNTFFKKEMNKKNMYAVIGGISIYNLFYNSLYTDEVHIIYQIFKDKDTKRTVRNKKLYSLSDSLLSFQIKQIQKINIDKNEYKIILERRQNKQVQLKSSNFGFKNLFKKQKQKKTDKNLSSLSLTSGEYISLTNKETLSQFYNNLLKTGFVKGDVLRNFGLSINLNIGTTIPMFQNDFDLVHFTNCLNKVIWDISGNTREGGVNIGWEWRFFGAQYSRAFSDVKRINPSLVGGYDQIQSVITKLQNKNNNEPILLNSWNFDNKKLPPRNHLIQFYVTNTSELHMHVYSCKLNVHSQLQYDIVYYSLLGFILSKKCDLNSTKLTFSYGEIYVPVSELKTDITKDYREMIVITSNSVKNKDFIEMGPSDFETIII